MRRTKCLPRTAALLVAVTVALYAAAPAGAAPSSGYRVQRVCGAPASGEAACLALKLVPSSPHPASIPATSTTGSGVPGTQKSGGHGSSGATPAVDVKSPFRGFLTPQDLHAAYALPTETASSPSQTVAVIDAFNDPTIEADLGVYDEQFGLPPCTRANGCFRELNQQGSPNPLPQKNGGWASEISIDVEMAHAICQSCHVLLVEADSESFADLAAAVETAVGAGATEISNSYGAAEKRSYLSFAGEYDHPGIVIAASSGDCGYLDEACPGELRGAEFPADSPDVLAVGGTTLKDRHGTWTSKVWDEGGSACSELFEAPAWQSSAPGFAATGCGQGRAIADVAAVGNPNTGVDVFDSTPEGGEPTGWSVFGGTSVSSPIIAAEFGLAGGAQGVAYPAATLYAHLGDSAELYDVVAGRNGACHHATICHAAVGLDGPAGVGSPIGLGAFAVP